MLEHAEEGTLTSLLGHLDVCRALSTGQRREASDECLSDVRVTDGQAADDTVGGSDMVSGVGEGGGREATVNRTDGLGHCLYMGVEE